MVGQVVHVDHYGNLITDVPEANLIASRFHVAVRDVTLEGPADSYQSEERLVALVGSSGNVEIAAPNASAADILGATIGETVSVYTGELVVSDREIN